MIQLDVRTRTKTRSEVKSVYDEDSKRRHTKDDKNRGRVADGVLHGDVDVVVVVVVVDGGGAVVGIGRRRS